MNFEGTFGPTDPTLRATLDGLRRHGLSVPTAKELEKYGNIAIIRDPALDAYAFVFDGSRHFYISSELMEEVGAARKSASPWSLGFGLFNAPANPAQTHQGAQAMNAQAYQAAIGQAMNAQMASLAAALLFGHGPRKRNDAPLWLNPTTITEEIIAYRGWHLVVGMDDDGKAEVWLKSVSSASRWRGPVFLAHETPAADNASGVYAVGVEDRFEGNWTFVQGAAVWGRVALSGTVVEGDTGYRAERATIQELFVDPCDVDSDWSTKGLLKILGDRYQCDVSLRCANRRDLVQKALPPSTQEKTAG